MSVCLVISFASLNQSIFYTLCSTRFYVVLVMAAVEIGGVADAQTYALDGNDTHHSCSKTTMIKLLFNEIL